MDDQNVLPDIVKAGDPALHEPLVKPEEFESELIRKITVKVMRKEHGDGLAAPQIGIPSREGGNSDVIKNSDMVKAGDPALHEPRQVVKTEEIEPDRIQKIIEEVLRKEPGVGLAGIPLRCLFSSVSGMGDKKNGLPDIVKAGNPVLHEPAQEVKPEEIGSERIQKIIDDMVEVMRNAPGVGLAAPQIGIPLRIIVLEERQEFIEFATKQMIEEQERRSFDILVVINPILKKKGGRTALFFEGCLSVDKFRAVVERDLEVEVTGLDRDGRAIKVEASGWQARIFQHECDHLDGTLYVDKMVPRTFRTVENLDLPLAVGCPKLGAQ